MRKKLDENYKTTQRKANKIHKCYICKGEIEIEEIYTEVTQRIRFSSKRRAYYPTYRICLFHDIKELKLEE